MKLCKLLLNGVLVVMLSFTVNTGLAYKNSPGASTPAQKVMHHQISHAEEEPPAANVLADLVLARPLLLVTSALGVVTYLATLPITVFSGDLQKARMLLVQKPLHATFIRCLGCIDIPEN